METDRLAQDLRKAWIQDGQMVITEPYFAVQNDYIQRIYQVTSNGKLREVPQEEYVLSAWEEVELLCAAQRKQSTHDKAGCNTRLDLYRDYGWCEGMVSVTGW